MSEESIRAHERGMRLSAMSMPQVTTLQLVHHAKRGVLRVGMFFIARPAQSTSWTATGSPAPLRWCGSWSDLWILGGKGR